MKNSEMRVGAVTAVKEAQILTIPLPEIHDDEYLLESIPVHYVLLNKEFLLVKKRFLYQMLVDTKLQVVLLK